MNEFVLLSGPGNEVLRLVLAANFPARACGLLARRSLAQGEGMLITPCAMVHTIGMRMPIDVVFVDCQWTVVHLAPDVAPYRVRWARRARSVIELAQGEINRLDLCPGDRFTPMQEDPS